MKTKSNFIETLAVSWPTRHIHVLSIGFVEHGSLVLQILVFLSQIDHRRGIPTQVGAQTTGKNNGSVGEPRPALGKIRAWLTGAASGSRTSGTGAA
ncbi:hypothetical protein PGT21_022652 [Puccinia graminis f. sp. tritici]|uniref:Uncharacterized protein n=1 Tax=Puccinia graminis f. sp. tritici TaxID=56615 RepID=A0A5B0LRG4_PUCGR|nr:hypothetical protein PGT21_022652 [Puccinia graminis f. sp. tritici]KAA1125019.1 hypothetical protein PGTUg99_004285 [Puccinia graminis f. sp. tritici]